MTQTERKVIRAKVGLLELAKQLGNVTQACRVLGYSRDSFYRFRDLYDRGGELAQSEMTKAKPNLTRTRTKSPQTNGICERFHKTLLDEFYRVAFRKKVYRTIEELQADLDEWMRHYNEARTHQGRWCFGKTPMQTFLDSRPLAREKQNIGEAA